MYPEIFYSNTFTLLAEAEVGKHFYWDLAGFLVHGQVLVVIWFVLLVLLVVLFLIILIILEILLFLSLLLIFFIVFCFSYNFSDLYIS